MPKVAEMENAQPSEQQNPASHAQPSEYPDSLSSERVDFLLKIKKFRTAASDKPYVIQHDDPGAMLGRLEEQLKTLKEKRRSR